MKKTAKTGTVTDEQGRVRFHGAFTGGFSAGYFNTVGSSEGFQPAQFVSSRSNRATQQNVRSIADYMDEGDGLLGGKISSIAGIDSFATSASDHSGDRLVEDSENLLNKQLLSELTVQVKPSDTIGKKLLATMGWRLGQGIGPRISKKRVDYFSSSQKTLTMEIHPGADLSKLPKSALLKSGSVTFAPDDEGKKVVIPPPKLDMYGLGFDPRLSGRLGAPSQENDFSVDLDDEDAYEGSSNTYRMSDVLGTNARGNNKSKTSQAAKRSIPYGQQPSQAHKRLKYTSGFAYNDEEDDVYSSAPLALTNSIDARADVSSSVVLYGQSDFHDTLVEDSQKQKRFHENAQETLQNINQSVEKWLGKDETAPFDGIISGDGDLSHTLNAVERCPSDNRPPLPGFHVARRPRVPPPFYPPPEVPSDFHPYHTFASGEEGKNDFLAGAALSTRVGRRQNPLDAAKARSEKMNDDAAPKPDSNSSVTSVAKSTDASHDPLKKQSIFDLIKPEARLKLQSAINAVNPGSQVQIVDQPPLPPRPPTPPPVPYSLPSTAPSVTTDNKANFTSSTTAAPARPMLTASHLLTSTFAGLSQAFKNRFATATTTEGAGTKDSIVLEGMATASEYTRKLAEKAELKASEDASLSAKIAPKVIHLKGSVRTVTPWAPSPLLCKRMNIRLPDISKTPAQLGTGVNSDGASLDPVRQLLAGVGAAAEPPVLQFGRGVDATAAEVRREDEEARAAEAEKLDVYQAPAEVKPDISVFKSIFEDTDEEEEEDNEEENDNLQESGDVAVPNTIGQTHAKEAHLPDAKPSTLPVVAASATAAVESAPEESGPVRFVPSKLRTTIANRSASVSAAGVTAKARGAARSRTSFDDPDQDDEESEVVLHRSTQGRVIAAKSAMSAPSMNEDEDTEDLLPLPAGGGVARQASQNTVSFGGGGLAGRARKGRTAAAGSLRERLLAQQSEDSGEAGIEGGHNDEEENVSKIAKTVVKRIPTSLPRVQVNDPSHEEITPTVRTAQTLIHNINTSAAEDFLADLSAAAAVPVAIVDAAPEEEGKPIRSVASMSEECRVEGPPPPPAPQGVSLMMPHRATSRFAPALPVVTGSNESEEKSFDEASVSSAREALSRERSAPPAVAQSIRAHPTAPLPPQVQQSPPPQQARELSVPPGPSAQVRAATFPNVFADAVLPPPAKFETSIQRLQNALQHSTEPSSSYSHGKDTHKERFGKKASKKEHKKSHKSHKSDKHKHKKDSNKKKDRKRDKKESSKKSKKSRNNDSSSSDDSSDGSSSESD